jgi:hypothetical protein
MDINNSRYFSQPRIVYQGSDAVGGTTVDDGEFEDAKQNSRRLTDAGMSVAPHFFPETVSLRLWSLPHLTIRNYWVHAVHDDHLGQLLADFSAIWQV